MTLRRVLLLEDDPLMQRFVSYATEDDPITLSCCSTVAQAMALLQGQDTPPFDMILTDLMLPGESGLSFLQKLHATPALAAGADIVALSAGIDAQTSQQLLALGVRRQLLKPVSVAALREVLFGRHSQEETEAVSSNQETVDEYFGGQHELFQAFAKQCRLQFEHDIATGDAAMRTQNFNFLHELAHSLKSTLLLLGQPASYAHCIALEQAASTHPNEQVIAGHWSALRSQLLSLADGRTTL